MRNWSNSIYRKLGATCVLGLILVSSCAEGGKGLVIVQNQIPEIEEGACKIPGGRTTLTSREGTLDVGLDQPYSYFLYPLIGNQLPSLTENDDTELNTIHVRSFSVEIESPAGINVNFDNNCGSRFSQPQSINLPPNAEAGAIVEIIRSCHADKFKSMFIEGKLPADLDKRVIVRVKIKARGKHGGSDLVSREFVFPVRICLGCLQAGYSAVPNFSEFTFPNIPNCKQLAANPFTGNPCNIAQDYGPILCCRSDSNEDLVFCPGPSLAEKAE